jgi:hypothetical protein
MTLGTTTPLIEYVENGVTLVHAVPFQFQASAELICSRIDLAGVETILTLGADYTVAGGGGSPGSVTKVSGGTSGFTFRIKRFTVRSQPTDYTPGDPFPAETHEKALDHEVAMIQEQDVAIAALDDRVDDVELDVATLGATVTSLMRLALFITAGLVSIPLGTDAVATNGHSVGGKGGATYVADAIVNAAWVAAHPSGGFVSANGRGFRLSHEQAITPLMFGALGGDEGGAGPDDGPAFLRARDYLNAAALNFAAYGGAGVGRGTSTLWVPKGYFFLNASTLDLFFTTRIRGEGVGEVGGPTTQLRWVGVDGIRTQRFNTTLKTGNLGAGPYTYPGADASDIAGLRLQGSFTVLEAENMGIRARTRVTVRDCQIDGFEGDGVYVHATGATDGNANSSEFSRVVVTACRRGFFNTSNDTNAMSFTNCSAIGNRQCGFHDNPFINNTYTNDHAASNGFFGDGTANAPAIGCSSAGNRYALKLGGNSANAPSGTTADTADWIYFQAGGATTGYPLWGAGKTFRVGGGFLFEGNATTVVNGCYAEGDQPPAQLGPNTLVLNGGWGGFRGGARIFGAAGNVKMNSLRIGDDAGVDYFLADVNGVINYTGVAVLQAAGAVCAQYYKVNGGATLVGQIYALAGGLHINASAGLPILLEAYGALTATVDGTGINLASGMAYSVNGTMVIDSTGAFVGTLYTVQNKIAGYTATETKGDIIVKADLAAGFTIVLPTAVGNKARFTFKKIQAAGAIVIDGAGAETIDGALTATLNAQNESITIVSDNSNWMII